MPSRLCSRMSLPRRLLVGCHKPLGLSCRCPYTAGLVGRDPVASSPYSMSFGIQPSYILQTWPSQCRRLCESIANMLGMHACDSMLALVTLSCQVDLTKTKYWHSTYTDTAPNPTHHQNLIICFWYLYYLTFCQNISIYNALKLDKSKFGWKKLLFIFFSSLTSPMMHGIGCHNNMLKKHEGINLKS